MTANKTYVAAKIEDLPAGKFKEALQDLRLVATDAKEAARVSVSTEWLRRDPQTQVAPIRNGEAGGILVVQKGCLQTLTCLKALTSNKCTNHYGCQATNDLVAHQIALVHNLRLGGNIIDPIYEHKAKDLGLNYNQHDARTNYGETAMTWPRNKEIKDYFSEYKSKKVVLGLIPVAIPVPYQCNNTPKGEVKTAHEFFVSNIDQDKSFEPIWRAWQLCAQNGFRSWHKGNSTTVDVCGISTTKLGTSKIYENVDKTYVLSSLECIIHTVDPTPRDNKAIVKNVYQAQIKALAFQFTERPDLARTYIKKRETPTYIDLLRPQTQQLSEKQKGEPEDKLTRDLVKNWTYMTMRILLTKGDKEYKKLELGKVRENMKRGFANPANFTTELWNVYRKSTKQKVFDSMGNIQYQ